MPPSKIQDETQIRQLIDQEANQAATCGWVRVTVCYAQQQDTWRVAHEHVSVPFDPITSEAAFIREL